MSNFNEISFSQKTLNRDADIRISPSFLQDALANKYTRIALFCDDLVLFPIQNEKITNPKTYNYEDIKEFVDANSFWIAAGFDTDKAPILLLNIDAQYKEDCEKKLSGSFQSLRSALWQIRISESEIYGLGNSLFSWHKNHQFCAKCGTKTIAADMGFKRICPNCNTEHFPRVDPVVIMLVLKDDKCLFGRSKFFPPGLYSILAGFMEPCETIEQACMREVFEETAIEIEKVEYIANQPWPFASQLMIGLRAFAKNDEIKINKDELEDALWLDRDQVRQLLSKNGLEINGDKVFGPRPSAIAHALVSDWLNYDK